MGLQDLLAVVLGVKTVGALEERRAAERRAIARDFEAARIAAEAQVERLNPAWEQRACAVLDRLVAVVPDGPATHMARFWAHEDADTFGSLALLPLYAAHLAGGDYRRFVAALQTIDETGDATHDGFRESRALLAAISASDAGLFDALIDVYLDDPTSVSFADLNEWTWKGGRVAGFGAQIQRMRWGLRLPPLALAQATPEGSPAAQTVGSYGRWRVEASTRQDFGEQAVVDLSRDMTGLALATPERTVSLAGCSVWPANVGSEHGLVVAVLNIGTDVGDLVLQPLGGQDPDEIYDLLIKSPAR